MPKPKLRDNWQLFINIQQILSIFMQNNLKKAVNDKQTVEQQLATEQTKNQQLELLLKAEQAKNELLIKQNSEKFSTDNQLIAKIEIPVKK